MLTRLEDAYTCKVVSEIGCHDSIRNKQVTYALMHSITTYTVGPSKHLKKIYGVIHSDTICIWHPDIHSSAIWVKMALWQVISNEWHLNPYRSRMDAVCIFSVEMPLNISSKLNLKYHKPQCKPQSAIWRQIRAVLNIETWSWSARNVLNTLP